MATKRAGHSSRALSRREALWVHCVFGCTKNLVLHRLTRGRIPAFLPRVAAARLGCRSRMPSRLSQHE